MCHVYMVQKVINSTHQDDLVAAGGVHRLQHRRHLLTKLRDLRGGGVSKEFEDVDMLRLARCRRGRADEGAESVQARRAARGRT